MSRDWIGAEFENAFDLGSIEPHNRATVERGTPVVVRTESALWSFAAGVALLPDSLAEYADPYPLVMRVNLTVKQGNVGALFVANDYTTELSSVGEESRIDQPGRIDLVLNQKPDSGWLILRNNSPNGYSECEVESVQLFRTVPGEGTSAPREIQRTADGRIDLAKLAEAVNLKCGDVAGFEPLATGGNRPYGEDLEVVPVDAFATRMGWRATLEYPATSRNKPFVNWKMETDDSPILRFLYRNFQPTRHLEFGTWQGTGVLYCMEECAGTVWTLNLLEGEKGDGDVLAYKGDSQMSIGRFYLERGFGRRVCQIYCDSREWDISNYPPGFFDTVLIDGGHSPDVVRSDTEKAFALLRPGGLCIWHDFCPDATALRHHPASLGVVEGLLRDWPKIRAQTSQLFWIEPSFMLVGIRRRGLIPGWIRAALGRTTRSTGDRQ